MGRFVTCVALVGLLAGVARAEEGEKLDLKLRLVKGETYKLRLVVDLRIDETIQEAEQSLEQTIGLAYEFRVLDVDAAGTHSLEVKFTWLRFRQEGSTGRTDYDSSKPPESVPPEAAGFAALVGKTFRMKVSPTGKVTEVAGIDDLFEEILGEGELTSRQTRQILDQLKEQFGASALQNLIGHYPQEPVSVDGHWTETLRLTAGFPLILENRLTLKSRESGVARLEADSKIRANPDATPIEMGPLAIRLDLEGSQKGSIEIEESTGWIRKGSLNQTLKGTVTVSSPGMPEPMTWPRSISSRIEITRE